GAGLGCGPGGIQRVVVNQHLLVALNLDIDPNMQQVQQEDKNQIKSFNNKFASFINKVQFLEQQNQVLETKWSPSKGQKIVQNNLEPMFELYIINMRWQLEAMGGERLQLGSELKAMQDTVEDFKVRYKDFTQGPREGLVQLLLSPFQGADAAYVNKLDEGTKVHALTDEINFLQALYEAARMQAQISNTSVVLSMDNNRNLDSIIAEVKAQYKAIANCSRAQAESWYQSEVRSWHGDNLQNTRVGISEMNRLVQQLHSHMDSMKVQ
ncbi:K2C75 protein, partial [Irena cyanogastra]|nr:K2C75 protein [Irena cyanogastra]